MLSTDIPLLANVQVTTWVRTNKVVKQQAISIEAKVAILIKLVESVR